MKASEAGKELSIAIAPVVIAFAIGVFIGDKDLHVDFWRFLSNFGEVTAAKVMPDNRWF